MYLLLYTFQARLRLSDQVEKEDVKEAIRLTEMSKDSLNHTEDRYGRWVYLLPGSYILWECLSSLNWAETFEFKFCVLNHFQEREHKEIWYSE